MTPTTHETEKVGALSPAKKKVAPLLPKAEVFIQNDMNVLLIGKHGTGKTETVQDLCREMGIKMKYYSCATLDPYTDLVGVPVPDKDNESGERTLEYVRPKEIDECEMIFFDELNRAHPKVLNAVMEIIQFGTINGESLPNLRCCWGAINPPEKGYEVESLDLALLDRFDYYFTFKPQVTASYLTRYVDAKVAKAMTTWWYDHHKTGSKFEDENYISPRRMTKLAQMYAITGNEKMLAGQIAPGIKWDSNKLFSMMRQAAGKEEITDEAANNIGIGVPADYMVERKELRGKIPELIRFLKANPKNLETHEHVCNELSTGVGGEMMVDQWAGVIEVLNPAIADKLVTSFEYHKRRGMKNQWENSAPTFKRAHQGFKGIIERHGII